jgi:hypothetical protein
MGMKLGIPHDTTNLLLAILMRKMMMPIDVWLIPG